MEAPGGEPDDDDFDWEAAVAEIDDVCLKSQRIIAPASAIVTANASALASDIDYTTASTWIYPANIPYREYQFNITKTALFFQHPCFSANWTWQNSHRCGRHVQLLSVVSNWKDCLHSTIPTFGDAADRSLS